MTCQRIRCRYAAGMRRRGKPFEARKPGKTHEQRLARARERYREFRKDPEWVELRREYERIYAEAHRRKRGIPRDEKRIAKRNAGPDVRVSTVPFDLWVQERLGTTLYNTFAELAMACRVAEESLKRALAGTTVRAGFVDKCLTYEGSMSIVDLYSGNFYEQDEPLLELAA
jgi:hypothetical protein